MSDALATEEWKFESRFVRLPRENVDTDQIIPARFLTTTSRDGLGPHAFQDWRYLADGSPNPDFALNRADARGARILVAGDNFGCGSSREHAVWALKGAGFRAIVSSGFADIFRGNALGNGLLPIQVDADMLSALLADRATEARLVVDLERCTLTLPDGRTISFAVPPFARHCLLHGIDEMQFLLGSSTEIDAYEARHPASIDTVDTTAAGAAA
jgi:3-isopropylmalate/(R)-2-methylmalate dehydratase small subunit